MKGNPGSSPALPSLSLFPCSFLLFARGGDSEAEGYSKCTVSRRCRHVEGRSQPVRLAPSHTEAWDSQTPGAGANRIPQPETDSAGPGGFLKALVAFGLMLAGQCLSSQVPKCTPAHTDLLTSDSHGEESHLTPGTLASSPTRPGVPARLRTACPCVTARLGLSQQTPILHPTGTGKQEGATSAFKAWRSCLQATSLTPMRLGK